MNDCAKRRTELFSNPDWLRYSTETGGLVERQENRFLTPAPFFEKQLRAMPAAGKGAYWQFNCGDAAIYEFVSINCFNVSASLQS